MIQSCIAPAFTMLVRPWCRVAWSMKRSNASGAHADRWEQTARSTSALARPWQVECSWHVAAVSTTHFPRAGMEELEEDVVALMRKRVYDLSGVLGKSVKVTLP